MGYKSPEELCWCRKLQAFSRYRSFLRKEFIFQINFERGRFGIVRKTLDILGVFQKGLGASGRGLAPRKRKIETFGIMDAFKIQITPLVHPFTIADPQRTYR
jgi:hypothetical protein